MGEIDAHKNGKGAAKERPDLQAKAKCAYKWITKNCWDKDKDTDKEFFLHIQAMPRIPSGVRSSNQGRLNDDLMIGWAQQLREDHLFSNVRILSDDGGARETAKAADFERGLTLEDLRYFVFQPQKKDEPHNWPLNWKGLA